jgi:hypothetical protein
MFGRAMAAILIVAEEPHKAAKPLVDLGASEINGKNDSSTALGE